MAFVCLFVWSMVQAQSSGHLLSSKVLLRYKEKKCKKKKNQGQRRKLQLNRKLEQWTTTALFDLDVKNLLFFVWKGFWQSSQLQSWWQSVAQMRKVEKEPRANKEASKWTEGLHTGQQRLLWSGLKKVWPLFNVNKPKLLLLYSIFCKSPLIGPTTNQERNKEWPCTFTRILEAGSLKPDKILCSFIQCEQTRAAFVGSNLL